MLSLMFFSVSSLSHSFCFGIVFASFFGIFQFDRFPWLIDSWIPRRLGQLEVGIIKKIISFLHIVLYIHDNVIKVSRFVGYIGMFVTWRKENLDCPMALQVYS
jgi:hypothetical protein